MATQTNQTVNELLIIISSPDLECKGNHFQEEFLDQISIEYLLQSQVGPLLWANNALQIPLSQGWISFNTQLFSWETPTAQKLIALTFITRRIGPNFYPPLSPHSTRIRLCNIVHSFKPVPSQAPVGLRHPPNGGPASSPNGFLKSHTHLHKHSRSSRNKKKIRTTGLIFAGEISPLTVVTAKVKEIQSSQWQAFASAGAAFELGQVFWLVPGFTLQGGLVTDTLCSMKAAWLTAKRDLKDVGLVRIAFQICIQCSLPKSA